MVSSYHVRIMFVSPPYFLHGSFMDKTMSLLIIAQTQTCTIFIVSEPGGQKSLPVNTQSLEDGRGNVPIL